MEGELRFLVLAAPGSAVAADTAGMSSTEGFAEFAAAGGKMESNPSCFFNESTRGFAGIHLSSSHVKISYIIIF